MCARVQQLEFPALAVSYVWVLYIDGKSMIDVVSKFPDEAEYLHKLRKKWITRRAIVRLAERRSHESGKPFRGRMRPIYAKEIAEELTEAGPDGAIRLEESPAPGLPDCSGQ